MGEKTAASGYAGWKDPWTWNGNGNAGSAISNCDVGSVTIKLSDEGFYNVIVGCTDMGTGCDTIIAQFVADSLDTDIDNIAVFGVDTDTSPYDSGSYASSTTYLTGMAAVKAAEQMREKLLQLAAKILEEGHHKTGV